MTLPAANHEVIVFCQMLSLALKSGRPLPESLLKLSGQKPDNRASKWCRELGEKMASGYSVQEVCRDLADFDPVLARLLPLLGDDRLIKVLEFYTRCLINFEIIRDRLKTALFYPLIVLIVLLANLLFLNLNLFPQVIESLASGERPLPVMVRLLHFTEAGLWPISLIIPGLIVVSLIVTVRAVFGMIDRNSIITRFYGFADALRLQETARLQSMLSLYLQAGLPLEESVENCAQLAGKDDAADLLSSSRVLSQGRPAEEAFAYSDVFVEIAHADLTPESYAEKLEYASESNYRNSCAIIRSSSQFMAIAALLTAGFFAALITSGVFDTYYWLIWMFS